MKMCLLVYRDTVRLFESKKRLDKICVFRHTVLFNKASPNKQTVALTVGHCVLGHDVIRIGAYVRNSEEPATCTFRMPESSRYMNMAAIFPAETSARFYRFARRRFGVNCSTLFHETEVTVSSKTWLYRTGSRSSRHHAPSS